MTNTLISVIIPTWNRQTFLKRTISSVLAQTYQVDKIYVCDDGSTDDSQRIVSSIKDKRVVWIGGRHNGNPGETRNKGLGVIKSGWVAFLDSDDEWIPNKIKEQIKFATEYACDAVATNAIKKVGNTVYKSKRIINFKKKFINFKALVNNNEIITSSLIVKRSVFDKIGLFSSNRKIYEDYSLWLRLVSEYKVGYLKKPLLIYRDEPKKSDRSRIEPSENVNYISRTTLTFLPWVVRHFDKFNRFGQIYLVVKKLLYIRVNPI